jgi:hypothetical protein
MTGHKKEVTSVSIHPSGQIALSTGRYWQRVETLPGERQLVDPDLRRD